jgi:tetratricopeptide (TPR) repeat protein
MVEIVIDDQNSGVILANLPRRDLATANIGDGRHGFEFIVPTSWRDGQPHRIEVRLPDSAEHPQIESVIFNFGRVTQTIVGRVEGVRGSHLIGWVWDRSSPDSRVELDILVRDKPVTRVVANRMRGDLRRAGIGDGAHGFEWMVEPSLVDGDESVAILVKTSDTFGSQLIGRVDAGTSATQQQDNDKDSQAVTAAANLSSLEPVSQPQSTTEPLVLTVKESITRATSEEAAGNLDYAFDLLKSAVDRDPKNFEVLFRIARVTLALGNTKDAKQYAMNAFALRPNNPKPSVVLARIAEMEGERLLALKYWSNVPKTESAYFERLQKSARILVSLERLDEGCSLLRETVNLRPNDVKQRRFLAQLLDDMGDKDESLEQWRTIKRLDPSDGHAESRIKELQNLRRPPPWTIIPMRYRGAMAAMETPIVLAVGVEPMDLIASVLLARCLSDHFQHPVDLLLPLSIESALDFDREPAIRNVMFEGQYSKLIEALFVLPEYMTANTEARLPRAQMVNRFVDHHRVTTANAIERFDGYFNWLANVTGMNVTTTSRPKVAPTRMIIVSGPTDSIDLSEYLPQERIKLPVENITISESANPAELRKFHADTNSSDIVVTSNSVIANLAALRGAQTFGVVGSNFQILPPLATYVNLITSPYQ